jgi:hypothetical protein
MALQHFMVEGAYLGARTIPDMRIVPGLEVRRHFSYVLYCIKCGEIWARFAHDGAEYTQLEQRPCAAHGDGRLSCRPEFLDLPTRFEPDWPPAAIAYEFNRMMELTEEA